VRGDDGASGPPRAAASAPPTATDARVAELEAELKAAHKTIRALLDKVELQKDEPVTDAARLEQLVASRSREVEEKSAALDAANLELRNLMNNFDKVVRQRNRALVESEAQLRRKNEELNRLNEMKTEFISIAAHELRTPLTSIVGYLDLMTEGAFGKLTASLGKPVDMARRNANRLVRLVEEMLDVSRIEAGKVALRRVPSDLVAIVRDVVDVLSPLAATRRHTLEVVVGDGPLTIDADPDKINQVATNLVANAIRYTPEEGTIRATVDRAPREQYAGHWARLRVRDDGIGIPRAQRDRIFEPFSDIGSAKHHTSSVPDSAGLGLYIARGLVDLHGGIISVDSEEGHYTEFTVLLPLAAG
jgi:two-component system, OmpR family, sensor kinase